MVRIIFIAIEGCVSSSITSLIDGFTIANLWNGALTGAKEDLFVTGVATRDGKVVYSGRNIGIYPDYSFEDEITTDYLVIPALVPVPEPDSLKEPEVLDYITHHYSRGATVASLCTGTFLLAETGLLQGRCATTNWQYEKKFRYRYPGVNLEIGRMVTEEDRLICSGAVTAMMHVAFRIVQREGSSRLASAWAKAVLIDPNSETQQPYSSDPLPVIHKDPEVARATQYMHEHLAAPLSIEQVAEVVCLSPRHFTRRFKSATGESPLNYLQKVRIQSAKELLENSLANIEKITRDVGYEDSSTFRRLFRRHTGLSPREYRDKFLLLHDR